MLIPFDWLFAKYGIRTSDVLHLGASTGQEAEAYHRNGVKRVIWVEAVPSVFEKLRKHVARYSDIALEACLSDVDDGIVMFHVASNDGQSSSLLEFGTHSVEHPSVTYIDDIQLTTSRSDTLLQKFGIVLGEGCFLNVDLQGAELLALKGMGRLLEKFRWAYIEVNEKELYVGCPLVNEIDDYLATFGFKGKETKMTDFGWGDKFYERAL